jgi:hypothetical protein
MGYLRKLSILRKENIYFKTFYYFKKVFSGYQRAADTLNESLESLKKSRNKHFVHN